MDSMASSAALKGEWKPPACSQSRGRVDCGGMNGKRQAGQETPSEAGGNFGLDEEPGCATQDQTHAVGGLNGSRVGMSDQIRYLR